MCILPLIGTAVELHGLVVGVNDGDTIKLLDDSRQQHTIRLMGIDAPEKTQAFGQQAKQQLLELCLHKPGQADVRTIDRYGRTVARVRCDGVDAASKMLQEGLAWHFTRYAHTQPRQEADGDRQAQAEAQAAKRGLWSLPKPMAPWDWRASH